MMKPFRAFLLAATLASLALAVPASAQPVDSITDAVAKFDEAPRPLKTKPPRYPEAMRAQNVSGAVVVALVIDESGKVIASEVRRASHDAFREPALQAVQAWTFVPAKVGGKAVRALVNVPLNFSVDG
jgi:TonB family protein